MTNQELNDIWNFAGSFSLRKIYYTLLLFWDLLLLLSLDL